MWEIKFKRATKKPEFEEKQTYVPQTESHEPGLPKKLTSYSNHVSKIFNDYCTEMGVQCIVHMNPRNYNRAMSLKVVGDRDVEVVHRGKSTVLAPGEFMTIDISDRDIESGRLLDYLPRLIMLPHGNATYHDKAAIQSLPGINRQFFQYRTSDE